ncbi:VOC family protein [Hoyosella subflava]|uniref:Glyoxalase/bleomycin resistance protein/dioxygenase n=1 Tax=Hoyosella subflava (strain DSM 45089 / JCM 17490 / NBRC 109087 / DQS3-9A1) TaxID=443218 RepID=F6EQQ9_HOYSD|nr:VOC family protein [Hoyosella subflava]AEF41936.1 Glyoxalase/bleomycin resistance protein/dioxygenase [Hoyosella subflava DQS3-9A1]
MTDPGAIDTANDLVEPSGFPRPGAVPYLIVNGAHEALNWYTKVFGASVRGEPITMDDGRIGHAELTIGEGVIYLAEEFPEMGLTAPRTGTASVSLMIPVDDPDLVLTRAREAGGRVERWTYQSHGQRNATLIDAFGHRWMLAAPIGGTLRHGDIAAFTVCTPDLDRAAAFYRAVLGWEMEPAGDQLRVTNTNAVIFLEGGNDVSELRCRYAVRSLDDALTGVEASGGAWTRDGEIVACRGPHGIRFELAEISGDERRPAINGDGPGDPAYLTFEVVDLDETQQFFRDVVGWQFEGSEERGGFEMMGIHPMSGMTRAPEDRVIPMWRVDDASAAPEFIRAAGGEVLAGPEVREYGVSAHCRDDQGGRFYLGS